MAQEPHFWACTAEKVIVCAQEHELTNASGCNMKSTDRRRDKSLWWSHAVGCTRIIKINKHTHCTHTHCHRDRPEKQRWVRTKRGSGTCRVPLLLSNADHTQQSLADTHTGGKRRKPDRDAHSPLQVVAQGGCIKRSPILSVTIFLKKGKREGGEGGGWWKPWYFSIFPCVLFLSVSVLL